AMSAVPTGPVRVSGPNGSNGAPKAVVPAPAPPPVVRAGRRAVDELDVLIRARYPVIYVTTWEEERVEQQLSRIAASRNKKLYVWTCTQGIVRSGSEPQSAKSGSGNTTDPVSALDTIMSHVEPAIYL